jgi:hypothetical protein
MHVSFSFVSGDADFFLVHSPENPAWRCEGSAVQVRPSHRAIGVQLRDEGSMSSIMIRNVHLAAAWQLRTWWGAAEAIMISRLPRTSSFLSVGPLQVCLHTNCACGALCVLHLPCVSVLTEQCILLRVPSNMNHFEFEPFEIQTGFEFQTTVPFEIQTGFKYNSFEFEIQTDSCCRIF